MTASAHSALPPVTARTDGGAVIECGLGIEGLTGSNGLDGIGPDLSIDSIPHAAIIIDEHSTGACLFVGRVVAPHCP